MVAGVCVLCCVRVCATTSYPSQLSSSFPCICRVDHVQRPAPAHPPSSFCPVGSARFAMDLAFSPHHDIWVLSRAWTRFFVWRRFLAGLEGVVLEGVYIQA